MIKIAIVEDVEQYRDRLKQMLSGKDEMEVIYESDNCDNIVFELLEIQPDIVIMDIDLRNYKKSGIEGVRELKREFPNIKVLMLTVFEDEEKIFGAIKAGADGYLLKMDNDQKIADSIIEVYNGKSSMNGIIAKKILEYFQKPNVSLSEEYNLTDRELEILELIVKGTSFKEIAGKCFISIHTMHTHVKNIYQKVGVHSRAEIAAKFRNS